MTFAELCREDHVQKSQAVRVMDVFVLGPMMILAGLAARYRHPVIGPATAVAGAMTIVFNGRNYLRVRRALAEEQAG